MYVLGMFLVKDYEHTKRTSAQLQLGKRTVIVTENTMHSCSFIA